MRKLGYLDSSCKWVQPYYSTMSEWDKELIASAFEVPEDKNLECTILIATDSYGMGINNPEIKLVIQWDIPVTFDAMIQRMGCAKRKGGQATFILITPKWTILKDEKEIEQRAEKRVGAIAKEAPKSSFSNSN